MNKSSYSRVVQQPEPGVECELTTQPDLSAEVAGSSSLPLPSPSTSSSSSSPLPLRSIPWLIAIFLPSHPTSPSPSLPHPHSTLSPSPPSFFNRLTYGHLLLPLTGIFLFMFAAGSTFGVGFYTEYLMSELAISRTEISTIWMIALFTTSAVLPLVGRLVDRFGPRFMSFLLILPYSVSLALLSVVYGGGSGDDIIHRYGGVTLLTVALCTLRVSMNSAFLVTYNLPNQWFVKQKAAAMSIVNLLGGAQLIFPTLQHALMQLAGGWRESLRLQAVVFPCVMFCVACCFYDRPETYGLLPDGRQPQVQNENEECDQMNKRNEQENTKQDKEEEENAVMNRAQETGHDEDEDEDEDEQSLKKKQHGKQYTQVQGSDDVDHDKQNNGRVDEEISKTHNTNNSNKRDYDDDDNNDDNDGTKLDVLSSVTLVASDDSSHLNKNNKDEINNNIDANNNLTPAANPSTDVHEEIHWHYMDAIRTKIFWAVVLGSCITGFLWSGFNFHYMSILSHTRLPAHTSSWIFVPITVFDLCSIVLTGVIFEVLAPRNKARGMLVGTVACGVSCAILLLLRRTDDSSVTGVDGNNSTSNDVDNTNSNDISAVDNVDVLSDFAGTSYTLLLSGVYGLMDAIFSVGYSTIFAYMFGRANLGTIDSIAGSCSLLSLGLASLLFGVCVDVSGSYTMVLLVLLMFSVLVTALLATTTQPKTPTRRIVLTT